MAEKLSLWPNCMGNRKSLSPNCTLSDGPRDVNFDICSLCDFSKASNYLSLHCLQVT